MNISTHLHSFIENLKKLKKTVLNKKNKAGPNQGDVITINESRDQAIQTLISRGKSTADAELIVKAMEEWELDYALAATMDFKVAGDSVWIDNEE